MSQDIAPTYEAFTYVHVIQFFPSHQLEIVNPGKENDISASACGSSFNNYLN